jgi:biopolymer transport protein ExbB/TolQ
MLKTFSGLASANGATPIESVSSGISQALVTTQAGLVVAVPAAFLLALLHRSVERTHLNLWGRWHGTLTRRGNGATATPNPS